MPVKRRKGGLWIALTLLLASAASPVLAHDIPVTITGSTAGAPIYFINDQGDISGIFVDIWNLWALKTGETIEFKAESFSKAMKTVSANPRAIIAGLSYSASRTTNIDYSKPFYEIPTHIFFHEQVPDIKGLSDLSEFSIGVVQNTEAEEYLLSALPSAQFTPHTSHDGLIRAAVAGEIKVFVCNSPMARYHL